MKEGNRHFEDTYNKLVENYKAAVSTKDYKYASFGMNNIMYPDGTQTPQKTMCKSINIYILFREKPWHLLINGVSNGCEE